MDNTIVNSHSAHLEYLVDLLVFKGRPLNLDSQHQAQVLVNHGFVVGYSAHRLQPLWSAYRVAWADRDVDYDRPHLYYDDHRLSTNQQIGASTFGKLNGVQLNVGHMTPNEVINRQFGRLSQLETFLMSNMSPQYGSLNSGVWLDLETQIRNIENTRRRDHVWAIAGPIFSDEPDMVDRPNGLRVPVPESYYYITVDPFRYPWDRPSNVDVVCFRFPQEAQPNTPLDDFAVKLSEIEDATSLKFFPQWPDDAIDALTDAAEPIPAVAWNRHRLLRQLR